MSTPGHSGHRAWPRDPRSSAARAADIDWSVPASGRIYDALLGGKNNLVVDQDAAAQLERLLPGTMRLARDNRDFLIRAVGHIAKHEQVGQFLDIGTGLPAEGAIHEIARQFIPDARVVYADNDPVAIRHGQALLAGGGDPHTLMVHADLRNPEQLLGDPEVRDLLNLRKPVAVFLVAVTHFLSDEDNPAILAWLCSQLAPGSIVVFSHVTPGTATDADIRAATAIYERSGGVHIRDGDQLASWLGHLELLEPGLVPVAQWRPTLAHDLGLTQLAHLPGAEAPPSRNSAASPPSAAPRHSRPLDRHTTTGQHDRRARPGEPSARRRGTARGATAPDTAGCVLRPAGVAARRSVAYMDAFHPPSGTV